MRRSLNSVSETRRLCRQANPTSNHTQQVLRKKGRQDFGHYVIKHLVFNHYRALAASDTGAVISEQAG